MTNDYRTPVEAAARPVLYLDIDDTLIAWANGIPRAAPGAREFFLWALDRFEVRWLTTWCPGGEMEPSLLRDLCKMLEVDVSVAEHIRGFDWDATDTKLNGVAWVEHFVLQRPFLWIEDEYGFGAQERAFLAEHGLLDRYRHCNVSVTPASLQRLHELLDQEWRAGEFDWPPGALHGASAAAV